MADKKGMKGGAVVARCKPLQVSKPPPLTDLLTPEAARGRAHHRHRSAQCVLKLTETEYQCRLAWKRAAHSWLNSALETHPRFITALANGSRSRHPRQLAHQRSLLAAWAAVLGLTERYSESRPKSVGQSVR